ncbi:ketopantoate reductase family protein [Shouchella shacheensis]|uniref:ketopantoate reductase family protein n=1 Tax=Shouchella shacheensis TaxID=1649580 RepID=UPI00073FC72A|nr:2-dehydropantoate 2-reductase [Shouchella shacheensis]
MNIAVVGAGAVGGFLGGMLAKNDHNLSFIARGPHLAQMQKVGLRLVTTAGESHILAHFSHSFECLREADLILFTVKSNDTYDTAQKVRPLVKENASILTFQNGVNNEEILSNLFGQERVLSGAAHVSAKVAAPGVIKQEGTHLFFIGGGGKTNEKEVKHIVQTFQHSDIHTKHSDRMMERKWEKSLWNVTFNPLSAVTGAAVGDILDDSDLFETAQMVLYEMVQIASQLDIGIRSKAIDRVFEDASLVRHHKTSMLQDREKGKPMEIEALCGYFVKKAKSLGVESPVLHTLYSLLKNIEKSGAYDG